ncbi:MAG: phosphatidylglycerophosphatase A [Cellvibrio sp.]
MNSNTRNPTFKQLLSQPHLLVAFGFGSGLAKKAPGTFGTLAAIPFFMALQDLSWPLYISWLVVTFVLGVWWCERASQTLGVHDHGGIVWDEFVGYWITMFMAPKGWLWIVLGFVLFRLFDILKPWPIGWVDRKVSGGFGIMIDDVIAGIFAAVVLQIIVMCVGV